MPRGVRRERAEQTEQPVAATRGAKVETAVDEAPAASYAGNKARYYIRVLDGEYIVHLCRDGKPTADQSFKCATVATAVRKARELNIGIGYPEELA